MNFQENNDDFCTMEECNRKYNFIEAFMEYNEIQEEQENKERRDMNRFLNDIRFKYENECIIDLMAVYFKIHHEIIHMKEKRTFNQLKREILDLLRDNIPLYIKKQTKYYSN